jgi:hypothetical protein
MQSFFSASNKLSVQRSVQRELRQAMKNGAGILYVEFDGYGSTKPELTYLTRKNKRASRVTKSRNDGSANVFDQLHKRRFNKSHLKVVGVNTDYCVFETVQGLREKLPQAKIEVIADACSSNGSHKNGLAKIKKIPNIKILRNK